MKKALVIMMLVVAAPLYAVTGTADVATAGEATVTIPTEIVALGLSVECSDGQIDTVVIDSFFDVFMDAAHDQEAGAGYVYQTGTAIADKDAVGEIGLPSASFAISAGGLDDTGSETPPATVTIVLTSDAGATVKITSNGLRGGMVDAAGAEVALDELNFVIAPPSANFDSGHADYAEYLAAGSPACWEAKYQCYGDATGSEEGIVKTGIYSVSYADLTILVNNWQGTTGDTMAAGDYPADVCADFTRSEEGIVKTGIYRISYADLTILVNNWQGTTGDGMGAGDTGHPLICGGGL